jgi:beta-lactam-binding protein with PASTA domain
VAPGTDVWIWEGNDDCSMPDVVGWSWDDAAAHLNQWYGVYHSVICTDDPGAHGYGAVYMQSPSAGTPLDYGNDVTIHYYLPHDDARCG